MPLAVLAELAELAVRKGLAVELINSENFIVQNHISWQILYLGQYEKTHIFCIMRYQGEHDYPIAFIKATEKLFLLSLLENKTIGLNKEELEQNENKNIRENSGKDYSQKNHDDFHCEIETYNREELIKSETHQDFLPYAEFSAAFNYQKEFYLTEKIKKQLDAVQPLSLKNPMSWQVAIQHHRNTLVEYYELLSKTDLDQSESDLDRVTEILQQAENDDVLSLLLNETDKLVLKEFSFNEQLNMGEVHLNTQSSNYSANYQKWAEGFKIHVDICDQLDVNVGRFMTKISGLMEKLQHIVEKIPDSPQVLEEKVESLELLMQEAKVEKNRRKLKICLNKPQIRQSDQAP